MNRRVLIIDDEKLIRDMLGKALEQRGFEVSTAADGQAGLQAIRDKRPNLVLLDLMMPKMDGFDVLEAVRADPATQGLQIIVLTARASQDVLAEALEAGADDYISKPFHLGEVMSRIDAHLRIATYARELEHKRRDSHTLVEISQRLTSRLDMSAILHDVASMVTTVLKTDRCSIVLLDDGGKGGRVVAASDDAGLTDRRIALSAYPEIRRVLETREPLVVADITADPLFDPVKDQLARLSVRSAALFPLLDDEACIGVLFLRSTVPMEAFARREREFGQIVANASAIAIRNAQQFHEIKEESDRLNEARAVVEQRLRIVQRYEDFFENSADGMFIVDSDGIILFVNRCAERITDVSRGLACGLAFVDLVARTDRSATLAMLERARAGDFSERIDLRLAGPRSVVISVGAARVPGDRETYSLAVRDVTEERALADELARTKDFLAGLIDASVDAIVATSLEGDVKVFNKAAERLLGAPAEQVVDRMHVATFYPDGGAAEVMAALRSDEHGGAGQIVPPLRREVIDIHGQTIPVLLSGALVQVEEKEAAILCILQDLREQIRMETQLHQTEKRLEQQEKQALLAELAGATAHELNQPLTSVVGYAELMKRRLEEGDPNLKAANTILSEAQRMAEIVKKIGHITRYETKHYVGSSRIIDLAASAPETPEE